MGLLIHISYETPEGIVIQDVYCRIVSVLYEISSTNSYIATIRVRPYLNRDVRIKGCRPLEVGGFPEITTVSLPGFETIEGLYAHVKANIITTGFSVEDVFESTDTIV